MREKSKWFATSLALAALLAISGLTGCVNLHKVVKELKQDPSRIKFDVVSAGVVIHFEREFPTNWTIPPLPSR